MSVDGRLYKAARLAWFYMTGEWPVCLVDHENGCPGDNRWVNLREATHDQNNRNARRSRRNTSGYKGVTFDKDHGRWRAQIRVNGKEKYLGLFAVASEAHDAYCKAAIQRDPTFVRTS